MRGFLPLHHSITLLWPKLFHNRSAGASCPLQSGRRLQWAPVTALQVRDVRYSYGRSTAVDGISLSVEPGMTAAVLGPNGAGKSTLISLCTGLLRPQSGSVEVFGHTPLSTHTRATIGVMLQDGGLPMAAKPPAILKHLAQMYAEPANPEELMDQLGIRAFADRSIRRLSGGQKQRVGLAAALIGKPSLVFLDEPTAGLDPQASLAVKEIVSGLADSGTAVVLTTHNMTDAQELADKVHIVDHGQIIAEGTPSELTAGRTSALRLTFAEAPPAQLSEKLSSQWGLSPASSTTMTAAGAFSAEHLSRITADVAASGAKLTGLSMSSGDLGDVFLQLTGRSLR